jgi:hypothetical protein
MYGNINTTIAFDKTVSATVTILPATVGDVVLSVPGADPNTDIVGMINCDPAAVFDIGKAAFVAAWVSADNEVTIRYYNVVASVTSLVIAAGVHFKGKIERCDNGFKADGL